MMETPANEEEILDLESMAARAWTAGHVLELDGWRLRFHWNITQRANSVWPNTLEGSLPLSQRLDQVESFYRGWGVPARYQVSPVSLPEPLDAALDDRGYGSKPGASVQTASVSEVLDRTGAGESHHDCAVLSRPDSSWFDLYSSAEGFGPEIAPLRRGLVQRISDPAGFAVCRVDEEPVAVGIGVLEGPWVGIFCMSTLPAARRQGAGRAVLGSLAQWASKRGSSRAYLQVMESNDPALALYSAAGFEHRYDYHYRFRDLAPEPAGNGPW